MVIAECVAAEGPDALLEAEEVPVVNGEAGVEEEDRTHCEAEERNVARLGYCLGEVCVCVCEDVCMWVYGCMGV